MAKSKAKVKDLLTDDDLLPENIRVTISIRLPGDLLDSYRVESKRLGIPYQTLMQMKLREGLENNIEKRLEKIEKKLRSL